jgi:anti-sigma regulatory factor (Ser/Thr protein kinase)
MSPALTGESCMIWRLADDPAELGHAREVVRKALVGWALSEYAELAELVVTELATNALRGAGPIDISLSFTANELRTEVRARR